MNKEDVKLSLTGLLILLSTLFFNCWWFFDYFRIKDLIWWQLALTVVITLWDAILMTVIVEEFMGKNKKGD